MQADRGDPSAGEVDRLIGCLALVRQQRAGLASRDQCAFGVLYGERALPVLMLYFQIPEGPEPVVDVTGRTEPQIERHRVVARLGEPIFDDDPLPSEI